MYLCAGLWKMQCCPPVIITCPPYNMGHSRGCLGCHKVVPVVQPLRRVSLALRDSVTEDLQRLQADGIIEPIDASNLVIARKKSGGLRI